MQKKMLVLEKTEFGNPVLRKPAMQLSVDEIRSQKIQDLISSIRYTLANKKYGIGLAAPQVGQSLSLSVVHIRPTKISVK